MLTLAELKRLIKKYDDLMGIVVKGKKLPELMKEVTAAGYTIDHDKKMLIRKGTKNDKKKRPKQVDVPKVEKKAPVDKSEALKKKKEMVIKLFLKHPEMHKEIMKDERIKKQGGY